MAGERFHSALRFIAPQAPTSARIVAAMYAIVLASQGRCRTAAVVLILMLGTDILDGILARRLGVESEFGRLFDYIADFAYYAAAPALITVFLAGETGFVPIALLSLPCVFAAMRYARKVGFDENEYPGIPASPGLPTIAYALFVIAVALLAREGKLAGPALKWLLMGASPILGALMVSKPRYPKFSARAWIVYPILAGLTVMPFAATVLLAELTLSLTGVYVILGPLMCEQHSGKRMRGGPLYQRENADVAHA